MVCLRELWRGNICRCCFISLLSTQNVFATVTETPSLPPSLPSPLPVDIFAVRNDLSATPSVGSLLNFEASCDVRTLDTACSDGVATAFRCLQEKGCLAQAEECQVFLLGLCAVCCCCCGLSLLSLLLSLCLRFHLFLNHLDHHFPGPPH